MDDILKSVYYNPSSEGSFGGKARLKGAVFKDTGVRVSDKDVTNWLSGEDAYTLHKSARVNYKRTSVIVYGVNQQFQADLVDMIMYAKDNDNVRYLLTCIDVFSVFQCVF